MNVRKDVGGAAETDYLPSFMFSADFYHVVCAGALRAAHVDDAQRVQHGWRHTRGTAQYEKRLAALEIHAILESFEHR